MQSEQKTVMSTGAGWAPESIRIPGSTLAAREERYVQDFIPIVPITSAAYVFMRQTTRSLAAAEVAESVQGTLAAAAEAQLAYTEITETLRKINHFIPVTKEQLRDVPGLESEIDAEMIAGIRERLSGQIIAGDGSAPNIEGFLDAGRTGLNTQAKGSDDVFTAIHAGITKNRVDGGASVDLIILHDNDWHSIRTIQTSDGVFIMGPPNAEIDKRLFGIDVLTTTDQTENTALMGDFARYARIPVIGSIEVTSSSEHASFFIQGVLAILAELRATLAVLREDAFTKVTGI
jgi:HK97 family phage major capsid protein